MGADRRGSAEQIAAISWCWTSFSRSSSLQRRSYRLLLNLRGVTSGRRCRIISQVAIKKSSCAQQCNYLFCPLKITHFAVATQTQSEQASDRLVLNVGRCDDTVMLYFLFAQSKGSKCIHAAFMCPGDDPVSWVQKWFMCCNNAECTSPFSLDVCRIFFYPRSRSTDCVNWSFPKQPLTVGSRVVEACCNRVCWLKAWRSDPFSAELWPW